MRSAFPLAVACVLVAACGRQPLSSDVEANVGATTAPALSCPSAPTKVSDTSGIATAGTHSLTCADVVGTFQWKAGAAGAACAHPLDCQPTCCACPAGVGTGLDALTSWCHEGRCAAPADVCCALAGAQASSCGF